MFLVPFGQGQEERKGYGKLFGWLSGRGNQGVSGSSSVQFTDWMIRITFFQVIEIRTLFAPGGGWGSSGKETQVSFGGW